MKHIMRNKFIDFFRGFSVVLMVFFSVISFLSDSLPDFLLHNSRDSFHFGDLVLPLFLFASGLSSAYFFKKREKLSNTNLFLDIAQRVFILFIIWVFLSPFSSAKFLGMDEIALITLMFLMTTFLYKFNPKYLFLISLIIIFSYSIISPNLDFSDYLGGFNSAIFYLPLYLSAFVIGDSIIKRQKITGKIFLLSLLLFILFLFISPINKMTATPSFILVSILFSILFFHIISIYSLKNNIIEYLGRNSIRYWVLMYLIFLIPLIMSASFGNLELPLNFNPIVAIIISLIFLIIFALISISIDKSLIFINRVISTQFNG